MKKKLTFNPTTAGDMAWIKDMSSLIRFAVIIKHPYRDWDYRVDLITAPEDADMSKIKEQIEKEMLGPFEVLSITPKVSDRIVNVKP